ncbi:hypothetical protein JW848_01300, partial [Candidatus Bipolaricaulota bacterium]|nr:hypothetical protein [Candidatus Bipolaricaulota bacterium]
MRKLYAAGTAVLLLTLLLSMVVGATDAEMYFSSDKNGQNRVTDIQEGDEIWICIYDPDENIDCDVRDKIWTDIKIMDPKTGAYIVWKSYLNEFGAPDEFGCPCLYENAAYVPYKGHWPGNSAGWFGEDYLEETGADTGLFTSKRSFRIGTREAYGDPMYNTHVVDVATIDGVVDEFQWGHYMYWDWMANLIEPLGNLFGDNRGWFFPIGMFPWPGFNVGFMGLDHLYPNGYPFPPSEWAVNWVSAEPEIDLYLIGRFENMDTLVGMYQDQNDEGDVAIAMMKIIDIEATISWDQEIYKDANASATVTVFDSDENLDCSRVEWVPVFILINPGSWYLQTGGEVVPSSFCALKRTGGVWPDDLPSGQIAEVRQAPIFWFNIYNAANPIGDSRYYTQYDIGLFDTIDPAGITAVSFYAQETGANTGVFQLNLNSILNDLGFNSLRVRDVLTAYYLDPNDFDDFKLATAYIEAWNHSITSFTDADRNDQDEYWLGRDPIYIQVIDANANVDPCCPEQVIVHLCDPHGEDDAEWLVLDETSSNSPVFVTFAGVQLRPVWDALGIGVAGALGGFQLMLDNWRIEAFNEDDIYVRYNDVVYTDSFLRRPIDRAANGQDLSGIGDLSIFTSFPPDIAQIRVANDVSFDVMSIGDTQVVDGETVNMFFLDRQGSRVSGYVNSDCVFVEVLDPDQDEDQARRERIDGYWDGGQSIPFGPKPLDPFTCTPEREFFHPVNRLLGDTNIFNDSPNPYPFVCDGEPKIYVLNPRSGRWAAIDLMETDIDSGVFRSAICVDLVNAYGCVPTLGVLPGDTIVAVYQDPSNHSDSAWISIKVGIGGGGTPPSQASSAMFVDETGAEVASYTDADAVYVKVVDPSHAGATVLLNVVEIAGDTYDVEPLAGATSDTFITEGLALELV